MTSFRINVSVLQNQAKGCIPNVDTSQSLMLSQDIFQSAELHIRLSSHTFTNIATIRHSPPYTNSAFLIEHLRCS